MKLDLGHLGVGGGGRGRARVWARECALGRAVVVWRGAACVLTARALVGALAADDNKIGPEGMRHLSEGLKANASVQSVTIGCTCTPKRVRLVAGLGARLGLG